MKLAEFASGSWEAGCDALLLGRLGGELASIYHDTLQAPLPPRLQILIERLDRGWETDEEEPTAEGAGAAR